MIRSKKLTDQDIDLVKTMRAKGEPWSVIARHFGRNQKAFYSNMVRLNLTGTQKSPKQVKRKVTEIIPSLPQASHRPMIALVGTPQEVTQTIREHGQVVKVFVTKDKPDEKLCPFEVFVRDEEETEVENEQAD
jgi:hypothetical protein